MNWVNFVLSKAGPLIQFLEQQPVTDGAEYATSRSHAIVHVAPQARQGRQSIVQPDHD